MTTGQPVTVAPGWGSPALKRATLTLSATQLISWGVVFYGFAVVSSEIHDDTGWSEGVIAGSFAVSAERYLSLRDDAGPVEATIVPSARPAASTNP